MPTVLRSGPYRFYFYSSDRGEPRHVHVERDDSVAKFWLNPIQLPHSIGFADWELAVIEALVRRHATGLRKAWSDHFTS